MKNIPNFITSLNLTSGFIAIIYASNGYIAAASWLILAAMVFDFLDGFSARLLKAYSDVGKELDSLADIVSFGVAPAIIIYHLLNDSLDRADSALSISGNITATITLIIPALMLACAALRLAVFNVDTTQATTFRGLPTPANALAVISIVLAEQYSQSETLRFVTENPAIIAGLTILLSLLMVSRIPFLSLKVKNLKIKGNEGRYLLAILVPVSLLIFGIGALSLIIPVYIIVSLISLLLWRVKTI
jgi:CDP-diacylglycerol---serine O-phosphatidyltransferase